MQEENNKLYIKNLSYDIDKDQLFDIFNELEGIEVKEATIALDRETGRPRGFGFVTVATAEQAQKAIELMNEKEVAGRTIFVAISKPPVRDNKGFGGGRSNYSGGNGGRSNYGNRY